jgi:hypothetical protein
VAPLPDASNLFTYPQKVYTTRVAVANRLPGLRPGMTADVEILIDQKDNVLSVPVEAVVRYDGKDHLAVQKPGGGFEWRDVIPGVSNDKYVEVKEGIRSGERVVLNPVALMSEEEQRAKLGAPTPPAAQPLLEEPAEPARTAAKSKGKRARRPVNPILEKLQNIPPEDRARMKSASLEQRIEILKKAGFTDEEIRQLGGMDGGRARPGGGRSRGSEP